MISGNQTWQSALSQLQKQPLYILELTDFGVLISSFTAGVAGVTVGGYGVTLYGAGGYGT
jgi:hypothetical protein